MRLLLPELVRDKLLRKRLDLSHPGAALALPGAAPWQSEKPVPSMWHVIGTPLIRSTGEFPTVPEGPDLISGTPEDWRSWGRAVWPTHGAAISHASPVLASRAHALLDGTPMATKRARRVIASLLRYHLRALHRPTPFGLFSGVAPGRWAQTTRVQWNEHRLALTPSGAWVADTVTRMETVPDLLAQCEVVATPLAEVNADEGQVVVPQVLRPDSGPLATTAEVRIGSTAVVRSVLRAAQRPTSWDRVVEAVLATHPGGSVGDAESLLTQLVRVGALVTNLRPPSIGSPVDHLDTVLHQAGAAGQDERETVARTRQALATVTRSSDFTSALSAIPDQPSADLLLHAEISLPVTIPRAITEAVEILEVLSPYRDGLPHWRGYRQQFVDRYGPDTLVPVLEVLAPTGLGYPPWGQPAPLPPTSRDEWLLDCAQTAAIDSTVEADPTDLLELVRDQPHQPTVDHTEVALRLASPSTAALDSGRFRLEVLGVSRNAGTMAGRFAGMTGATEDLRLALGSSDAVAVQLSFPPIKARTAHVTQAPQILDQVLSVGEHPPPGALSVHDLAVGSDDEGLFLWSHTLTQRIRPQVLNALNLRFAPRMARFLAELPRAERRHVAPFDWGVASSLPFLPRMRKGHVVLSPAQWRVRPNDLPPASASWAEWETAWAAFADRRHIPARVDMGAGDQRLRLDVTDSDHLYLLRTHLRTVGATRLREAPSPTAFGWCGGRATEILVQLSCKDPS